MSVPGCVWDRVFTLKPDERVNLICKGYKKGQHFDWRVEVTAAEGSKIVARVENENNAWKKCLNHLLSFNCGKPISTPRYVAYWDSNAKTDRDEIKLVVHNVGALPVRALVKYTVTPK